MLDLIGLAVMFLLMIVVGLVGLGWWDDNRRKWWNGLSDDEKIKIIAQRKGEGSL